MPDDTIITPIEGIIQDDEALDPHDYLVSAEGERDSAERELLEFTHVEDGNDFQLTLTCRNGVYTVLMVDLRSGTCALGEGRSFPEAWHKRAKPGPTTNDPNTFLGPTLSVVPTASQEQDPQ
jgi:hypothetical protein